MKLKAALISAMVIANATSLSVGRTQEVTDAQKQILFPSIDAFNECLFPTAKRYASETKETAEAIQRATFAACARQRSAVLDAYRRLGVVLVEKEIEDFDRHSAEQVMLAIVDTRASIHRRQNMTREEANRLYYAAVECSTIAFKKWLKKDPTSAQGSKIVAWADCTHQWGEAGFAWEALDHSKTIDTTTQLLYDRWMKMDITKRAEPLL